MLKKMKSSLFDHLWLKLFALIIAFILWFAVMNLEDSTITKTVYGITVEMLNGDTLLDSGVVYDVTEGETVDIVVKGPRSIVENLEYNSFRATADLSHLSVTNSTVISVTTNENVSEKDSRLLTIAPVNQYVTLSIEEETEKSIPVKVITTGNVKTGLALGSAAPAPNMITVKGPESVLANIVEARAVVDVTNADENIEEIVRVGCIDGYGTAIQKDNVKLSDEKVTVSIPIYKTKTIPVNVSVKGVPGDGYGVRDINFEPSKVLVAGSDEALHDITSIEIADISVSDAQDTIEKNVDIYSYLPENIIIADETSEIAVSVTVEKVSTKEITLSTSNISVVGINNELDYEITDNSNLKIKVTGFEEDLADINIDSLNPRISAQNLSIGEHNLQIDFDESKKYKIEGTYTVTLEIKEGQ